MQFEFQSQNIQKIQKFYMFNLGAFLKIRIKEYYQYYSL